MKINIVLLAVALACPLTFANTPAEFPIKVGESVAANNERSVLVLTDHDGKPLCSNVDGGSVLGHLPVCDSAQMSKLAELNNMPRSAKVAGLPGFLVGYYLVCTALQVGSYYYESQDTPAMVYEHLSDSWEFTTIVTMGICAPAASANFMLMHLKIRATSPY